MRCPGLASTVMSADLGKAGRVANQIRAGAVYATDTGDGILNEFPKCARPSASHGSFLGMQLFQKLPFPEEELFEIGLADLSRSAFSFSGTPF